MRLRSLLALLAIVLAARSASASPILAPETVVHAQFNDALALRAHLGVDNFNLLKFNYDIDNATGDFSYSTAPGQTYLGQSIILSTTGSFDAPNSTFNYSATGLVGADAWSSTGSTVWVGDPVATINQNITINTPFGPRNISISGTMNVDESGNSNGTLNVAGPGINANVSATVTDFVSGNTWTIGGLMPNLPPVSGKFNTTALAPNQLQGQSEFALPEPGALSLLALAAAAALCRSRRTRR